MAGYRSGKLVIFDGQTGKVVNREIQNVSDGDSTSHQPNKLIHHDQLKVVISGNENGEICVYDMRKKTPCLKSRKVAHESSVTSLAFEYASRGKTGMVHNIHAGSSNGSIRMMDFRKMEFIKDYQSVHRQKYDEGVKSIVMHPS